MRRAALFRGSTLAAAASVGWLFLGTCQPPQSLLLLSPGIDGPYGNEDCWLSNITPDGRYVVFESDASNLLPGDTNGKRDVFLYDTRDGELERVSVGEGGEQANGHSAYASTSDDGRYVAFMTQASNLAPDDTNSWGDVLVQDAWTGANIIASRNGTGEIGDRSSGAPVLSHDGRYLAFVSVATNLVAGDNNFMGDGVASDVFVKDLQTGEIERVSLAHDGAEANGGMYHPIDMTPDARYVVFRSIATNLVPDDSNGKADVFLHDRLTHTIERVNLGPENQQDDGGVSAWNSPRISADGRFVAFASRARSWTPEYRGLQVYVRDRQEGHTEWIEVQTQPGDSWTSIDPAISRDGRYVVFESGATAIVPGDLESEGNIFRFDRETGEFLMVDVDFEGNRLVASEFPVISGDGKTIAFVALPAARDTIYMQMYVAIGLP